MEEIIKETVTIDGVEYALKSNKITKDYISAEYILLANAVKIYTSFEFHREEGCRRCLDTVNNYVSGDEHQQYLDNGQLILLETAIGMYYASVDFLIRGSGTIHKALNDERPYLFYDDYIHRRKNRADKFRAFDNLVKPFTDIDNPNITIEDKKLLIKRDFDLGVRSNTYKIFEGLRYTFGVELETSAGRLSQEDTNGLNLKCEFDGSLRETPDQRKEDVLGGEYITGVLKGDSGMYQLQAICNKLSEKCSINSKAGVHVHIGGISFTKENIVYLYILGCTLQDEIYQMLPTSRRKNSYCRKIDELDLNINSLKNANTSVVYDILIDEYYNKIFKYVSHGKEPSKNVNRKGNHPLGSKCGYNKETQRYCWLNFVTALFNTKNNVNAITLEFRNHSATLNYTKVKNWVRICFAFVNFAENFKTSIKNNMWLNKENVELPINLTSIIMASYPRTGKALVNYVETRKVKFFSDTGSIENEEYATDKESNSKLSLKEVVACA